jgi:soluble lytic murein transglycosylase-like protein
LRLNQIRRMARRGDGRLTLALGLSLALFAALPARAQVIAVGDDGAAVTYAGPVISSAEGVRPIAPPVASQPASPGAVVAEIRTAAARQGLSDKLVEAVAWQESHLDQSRVSPKGARGVMQLMPGTSRDLGVDAGDLSANLDGGTAYLAQLLRRYDGDVVKALAAYNAGPAAVDRYGGTPPYPETRAYVAAILKRLAASAASQSQGPQTAVPESR